MMFGRKNIIDLIQQKDWDAVIKLCQKRPKQAARRSHQNNIYGEGKYDHNILPLHLACSLNPTVEAVRALVEAYPPALYWQDTSFRRLPLHIACRSGASGDIIQELIALSPAAVQQKDRLGRLPLHYAISNGVPKSVIENLILHYPDSLREADEKGWLPLHIACHHGLHVEILQVMLDAYPAGAQAKTKMGNTPITLMASPEIENKNEIVYLLEDKIIAGMVASLDTMDYDVVWSTFRQKERRMSLVRHAIDLKKGEEDNESQCSATTAPSCCNCHDRDNTCAICLEEHDSEENDEDSNDQQILHCRNCHNMFHKECILDWLKGRFEKDRYCKNLSCPACRAPMLTQGDVKKAMVGILQAEHCIPCQ